MLADLREHVLPALADEEVALRRAAAIGNVLVYLSGYEQHGRALAEREREEVAGLLGSRRSDPATDARRVDDLCQDPARESEVIAYLARRNARELALWGPALGERATKPVSVEAYL
jgi:hypothetical protein